MMRYSPERTEPLGVDGTFEDIRLLAWGPEGEIYLLDKHTIKVIASNRSVRTVDLDDQSAATEFRDQGGIDGSYFFDMVFSPQWQIYLADWGRQRVLRISPNGVVSVAFTDAGNFGPEGLAFHDGGLVVFESMRPRANQGILPKLIGLRNDGKTSLIYEYSR